LQEKDVERYALKTTISLIMSHTWGARQNIPFVGTERSGTSALCSDTSCRNNEYNVYCQPQLPNGFSAASFRWHFITATILHVL